MIKTPSIISHETMVVGDLKCTSSIEVEGKVSGNIYCDFLSVKKSGIISGNIHANSVTIGGSIDGNIKAKNVKILKSSIVKGDILYVSLIAENGCMIEGKIQKISAQDESNIAKDKSQKIFINSDKEKIMSDNIDVVLEEES